MKHLLLALILSLITFLHADKTNTLPLNINEYIKDTVERVDSAREDAISSLASMISAVDTARSSDINNSDSIITQIIEAYAISDIAKSTANIEAAKANATSLITQAIDKLDPKSIGTVANAIASVEVAKAKAASIITQAIGRVEISKTKSDISISHPKEALTIAKNMSAIQIATSVAQAEVAKAVSMIVVAKSSIESSLTDSLPKVTEKSKQKLEDLKATATANISSYLAQIEVTKANMLSKIAQEVAKVELVKLKMNGVNKNTKTNVNTYPTKLIKTN